MTMEPRKLLPKMFSKENASKVVYDHFSFIISCSLNFLLTVERNGYFVLQSFSREYRSH